MVFNKDEQYYAYNVANETVPKTRQVVMLYDGAIRLTQQARTAIEEKRIEDRYNLLNKASEVILGLQGCLDFQNGGEVAPLLYDYYSSLDTRLLYIQRTNDLKYLDSVTAELKEMRGAWGNVDLQASGAVAQESEPADSAPKPNVKQEDATATCEQASTVDSSVFVSA